MSEVYIPGELYQVTTLPADDPAAAAVKTMFEPGEIVTVREVDEAGAPTMEVPPAPVLEIHAGRAMRVPPECEPYFVRAADQEQ